MLISLNHSWILSISVQSHCVRYCFYHLNASVYEVAQRTKKMARQLGLLILPRNELVKLFSDKAFRVEFGSDISIKRRGIGVVFCHVLETCTIRWLFLIWLTFIMRDVFYRPIHSTVLCAYNGTFSVRFFRISREFEWELTKALQ